MSIKILIADDEAVNRELLGIILEKEGYQLFFAKDGKETLALICKEKIDLVLLDLMMPKMDGIGVIKELKKQSIVQPKIIIVTALRKEEREPLLESDVADGYVTKPYDIVQLKHDIRSILESEKKEKKLSQKNISNQEWYKLSIEYLKGSHEDIENELLVLLSAVERYKKGLELEASTSSEQRLKSLIDKV